MTAQLDPAEVKKCLEADVPESRKSLNPRVAAHADMLTTSFDMIDETHREAGEKLVDWIVKNYKPGQPLHVTVICTGNSRRSILGATMGNIAAAYYGMPEIRFHSGGTAPSAFNPRAIAALKEIGVEVEPTGKEAPRGEPKTANPIYVVRWGSGMEATEFSKTYFDARNPQQGFAALMVCGEADAACPFVKGAAVRISMPYLDPKIYDDSTYESQKYAERRDDIGRLMLCVMMQVRNRLNQPSPMTQNGEANMSETITQAVKDKYGSVATSGLSSDHEGVRAVAEAFGYTPEELASIPAEANMGLSCGNPTAFASLREGEVVVDLGSGGGLDVLLAARKVGPTGKAIGIDMTQEMIDLARRNAAKSGLANIEYHLATIDKLPLSDASVDCVISQLRDQPGTRQARRVP